jgi:hypothetical protein
MYLQTVTTADLFNARLHRQPMPVGVVVRDAVAWHGSDASATKRTRIRAGGLATAGGVPA